MTWHQACLLLHLLLGSLGSSALIEASQNVAEFSTFRMCLNQRNGSPVTSTKIGCSTECARQTNCLACTEQGSSSLRGFVTNGSALLAGTGGGCWTSVKKTKIDELLTAASCDLNKTMKSDFLVLFNESWQFPGRSLSDFLCSESCRQLGQSSNNFSQLMSTSSSDAETRRCSPMSSIAYFGGSGFPQTQPLAVSWKWRELFVEESLCTHSALPNSPPLKLASWVWPIQLDVCGHSCAVASACEFFIFNSSGCFHGSLSRYLGSRSLGMVGGCSIQHKVRSWASSALAYYNFNASWLNLVNPGVMPAVNNSLMNVNQDGFLVPTVTSQFVRLNLSHIGFDSLVRSNTPLTFVMSFIRTTLKERSELMFFASCSDFTKYNGAINEQSTGNVAWYLNSETGKWHQTDSVVHNSTYSYPDNSVIKFAVAMNATTGYYVINGIQVGSTFYKTFCGYYDATRIGCMYVGFNFYLAPTRFLYGRINVLGIFTKMLSADEIAQLF